MVALATEAVRRQDWSEALTAWKRVRDRLPDHPAGIVWHAVALRELGRVDEAELVIAEGVTQFPTNTAILVEWARVAEKRRAWVEAMSRWETVRLSSPDIVEGHLGVGTALREVGQFDAAEATLAEALRGFPANPHLLIAQAWVAQNRRDWQEARSRWETVSSVCPGLVNGPLGVGTALRELGELDAADMTFTDAIARFPANPHLMIAYAWVAQKRPDWPATLLRWETVRSLHPHLVEGHLGIGTALREMGELEQADEFLSESIRRFPNNLYLLLAHARVAQARKNWEQALRRWEALRSVYPDIVDGYLGAGAALRELGRFEPAETLLSRALDHFPDSLNLRVDHARLAESVHNWGLALIRWEAACALAPDDEQLARYTGHARYQNQLVTIPLDAGVREPRAPAAIILETGEISPRDLMMHFESLGCGCEFGVVQRHFGAEPLGLLRWGSIAPLNLAKALQVRFEGMGDPKQARLSETPSREYTFEDRKFGMAIHTFIDARAVEHDIVLEQQCRRVAYLKNKLLEDLRSGEKIFVYRPAAGNLSKTEADRLHQGMRRYGASHLLVIQLSGTAHAVGTVECPRKGLLLGYIDGLSPSSNALEIKFDAWLHICRTAFRLWQEHRDGATRL